MATNTLYLASTLLAEGDNNKYLVVNNALQQLEDSINRILAVDMSSGSVTLTESQFTSYGIFVCSGHSVARDLILPTTVGASPSTTTNRQITVRNDGTSAGEVTVTHNVASEEVALAISTGAVVIADGADVKNVSLLIALTADVIAVTSSRSFTETDRQNILDVDTTSAAVILTIDPDGTTDLAIGTTMTVSLNDITNSLTLTAGAGVDLNFVTAGSGTVTSALASTITLFKRAADSWVVNGDIGAIA